MNYKEKPMLLEPISPTWVRRMRQPYSKENKRLMSIASQCIVGEAHGWSKKYVIREGKDKCASCTCYGAMICAEYTMKRIREA